MTNFRLPSATSRLRATKFSATRLPTSCGEVPLGQSRKYDCAVTRASTERSIASAKITSDFLFDRNKVFSSLNKIRSAESFDADHDTLRSKFLMSCGQLDHTRARLRPNPNSSDAAKQRERIV